MDAVNFIRKFPLRSYAKGQSILSEGETVETLLSIREGYIKVTSFDTAGSEHMLWIASCDDIIPSEHFFSLHNQANYFYTALSPVSAYHINKAELLSSAREIPSLMTTVAASLSDNYDDLLLRINAIDQSNIHDRLITTLRYLALRFGNGKAIDLHQIGLLLTHQDIAEMIGSTRETTSLELEKLREQRVIDYNRSSFIIYP